MNNKQQQRGGLGKYLVLGMAMVMFWTQASAEHDIRGITGPNFELYAFPFNMNLPDGSSLHMWGFGDKQAGAGATHPEVNGYGFPQYPAPTLIVNQGDVVTISLENAGVPNPVSIVVAGHQVEAQQTTGTVIGGLVTVEAEVGVLVVYTFTAWGPGPCLSQSVGGSYPGLQ